MTPPGSLSLPAADRLRANRHGILYMIAGMACFIFNDALIKLASEAMPAAQLIFLRGLMASVLVLAVAHALGETRRIVQVAQRWVAARAGVDALATMLYLVALFQLPLGNITAINMASPLIIAALAVPLLAERVDARRWWAIGVGFLGVLLVIQPRAAGFNAFSLVALAATVLHSVRDLMMRRIGTAVPAILVTLSTAVAVTLLAGVLSLAQGWQPYGARELALLALAAVFLAGGYHFVIRATRAGELSVIAPFRYTGLLWALVLGFAVWREVPNAIAWAGILLLIGAGLYTLHNQRNGAAEGGGAR
jgi:drug/metabolite transporter (DMT)-like permease